MKKIKIVLFFLLLMSCNAQEKTQEVIEKTVETKEVTQSETTSKRRKKALMCKECGKPEVQCECEGPGHGVDHDHGDGHDHSDDHSDEH